MKRVEASIEEHPCKAEINFLPLEDDLTKDLLSGSSSAVLVSIFCGGCNLNIVRGTSESEKEAFAGELLFKHCGKLRDRELRYMPVGWHPQVGKQRPRSSSR